MNTKIKADYIIYDQYDTPLFIGKKVDCMKYLKYNSQSFECLVSVSKKNPIRQGYRVFKIVD